MRIPILTFGAIASVLTINSVIADTVVTSRNYVDTQDALKQDKITAGTTGSVVTYNGTQNGQTQFSERAIYDGTNDYDETTDANKLITAGAVNGQINEIYDEMDYRFEDQSKTMVTRVECAEYQNGECILFSLREVVAVFGGGCSSDDDCSWLDCGGNPHGSVPHCHSGIEQCACVRPDEL